MKKTLAVLLILAGLAGCSNNNAPSPTPPAVQTESPTASPTEQPTEAPTEIPPIQGEEISEPYSEYAGNPMIWSIYTADPSARVFGDKVYIYASHDIDPPQGCDLMDKYHVYSSSDLANWTDEGEILKAEDVSWGRPEGGFMWAPDCVYKDGKYYFYFPHPEKTEWNNSWRIGVAVSDFPNKDFKEVGYVEGMGGFAMIDPNVFIDDDGRAYLYFGGGSRCVGGELEDDMVTIKGEIAPMAGLIDFHEAAWVFKRAGVYYMTYADNNSYANQLRWATSDNPLGPWEYRGVYLLPTGCDTSHGSVVEFKGKWYQFYHNQSISGNGTIRSVCADELFFDDEGNIVQVEQTETGLKSLEQGGVETRLKYEPSERLNDSFVVFSVEGGFDGQRANLRFYYDPKKVNTRVKLVVNGEDLSFINTPSNRSYSDITVKLQKGENRILINSELGSVKISYMTVKFLD